MEKMSVSSAVLGLIDYAVRKGLLPEDDRIWAANAVLRVLHLDGLEASAPASGLPLEELLESFLDDAVRRGVIQNSPGARDLLDTAVMGCVTPPPSAVIRDFRALYARSPKDATDWFYRLSMDCDYIREYRLQKDIRWTYRSRYGDMEITINLAKPEKDPLAIAAAAKQENVKYPACQLCRENEGYAGRTDHPAKENLRLIPVDVLGEPWSFQYSPYVYYNEHCIVLNNKHTPMVMGAASFRKLFSVLDRFPHYFIGSNAELPIVGGSILSHEHFQGGRHVFPIDLAAVSEEFRLPGRGVACGLLDWPMAVLRLAGADSEEVVRVAESILETWRDYDDEDAEIISHTGKTRHNTVTPIARRRGGTYELDIVLRNNRTTAEHPLGLFHPHEELHHIKKENIGLIEVMGLAILPPHLKGELKLLGQVMVSGGDLRTAKLSPHADWAEEIVKRRQVTPQNIEDVLLEEVGAVFVKCLEQSNVFGLSADPTAAAHRCVKKLLQRIEGV